MPAHAVPGVGTTTLPSEKTDGSGSTQVPGSMLVAHDGVKNMSDRMTFSVALPSLAAFVIVMVAGYVCPTVTVAGNEGEIAPPIPATADPAASSEKPITIALLK